MRTHRAKAMDSDVLSPRRLSQAIEEYGIHKFAWPEEKMSLGTPSRNKIGCSFCNESWNGHALLESKESAKVKLIDFSLSDEKLL